MPVKDEPMINEYITTSTTNIATEIAADLARGAYAISYDGSAMIPTTACTTTSTTVTPEYIFYGSSPLMYETYVDKAVDKIDQHVDKLEEDIDYFNHKLEENDKVYDIVKDTLRDMNAKIIQLNEKIENMKKEITFYESLISEDHMAVMELKEKNKEATK